MVLIEICSNLWSFVYVCLTSDFNGRHFGSSRWTLLVNDHEIHFCKIDFCAKFHCPTLKNVVLIVLVINAILQHVHKR